MESLYLLVPLSVLIVLLAMWVFARLSATGQFDDLDSPAWRILLDEEEGVGEPIPVQIGDSTRSSL
jgi:cbb3-type cytochrome oxidase maturation protein